MSGSVLGEPLPDRGPHRLRAAWREVYRGVDPVLDRTVAIKILLPAVRPRRRASSTRFRREAQAAARLNHPNIVGVFDSGADGETQYIVMEFIEGRTLARLHDAGRHASRRCRPSRSPRRSATRSRPRTRRA